MFTTSTNDLVSIQFYQGKYMSIKTVLAASLAVAALTGVAAAQDYSLPPTYGSVALNPGFLPDPHQAQVVAGGTIDASSINNACVGLIANAPDYRLQYGGGGSQLFIGVTSSVDTTLVVNGPDGSWYCNDDYNGLNPLVGGEMPDAGQYDIWVGTYGSSTAPATIFITEYDQ
ncbi:hypothetical protein SAMN04488568_1231 [Maricaulis salignorans]|uniref:Peptidase S1 n=2 Tax=Maricaulis salignorans TaxID=144026 RepID=A0A1G9W722_9PROT|nr:hypothetical protein SAMN04488568_1231 [Maricaulis salignorans]